MKDNKMHWDEYFMQLAELVSTKSPDPNSKFGCIAVAESKAILSTGYNGPPRYVNDDLVPLTRPEKYIYFEHAERNCIYNAARHGIALENSTFYVTGICCTDCLRAIYQVGAVRVVMKDVRYHSMKDEVFDFIKFIEHYMDVCV